jgi:hypothetical protein
LKAYLSSFKSKLVFSSAIYSDSSLFLLFVNLRAFGDAIFQISTVVFSRYKSQIFPSGCYRACKE